MAHLDVVTEPDDHGPPPPPPSPPADAPAGSVLAQLRARAAEQARDRTLDVPLDVEPWRGLLVARYRLPPMEDADRLMAASATLLLPGGVPASMSRTSVDLMATCCVTLLGRADDGHLEDLEHRYTGRLLALLELPLPAGLDDAGDATVAEVIDVLFGHNWLAVNVHASQVMGWLQEGGAEPMGEASADS